MFDIILFQRAFLACILIGFANGYTSAFVLLNRSPLKLTALSHALLPGMALASLAVGLTVMSAFVGSVLMAVFIGALSIFLARHSRLSQDTTLSILYTGAFAFGIMLLNRIGQTQELEEWLFGDILGLSNLDMLMSYFIGIVAVLLLTLFQRPLLITLFEQDVAQTLGIPVRFVNYVSFSLLILVLVTTFQAVGCILSIGLIVTPGATVRLFTNSPERLFLLSGIIGAVGSCLGLFLAYHLNLPAESSIVMTLSSFFLFAFLIRFCMTLYYKKTNNES